MAVKELEFRGISKEHLGAYFEELGARKMTDTYPFVYQGEDWSGQILSEQEMIFTANFKVNAIKVLFSANDEESLKELIKRFRYKTTRVGG